MNEAPASSRVVHFNDIEVDLEACELHRQGRAIHLPRAPAKVLAALLERPGQVIKGEEFHQRIWPHDSAPEFEQDIKRAIEVLRHALNDSGVDPAFLETVSDLDYRFAASLEPSELGNSNASIIDRIAPATVPNVLQNLTGSLVSHFRIHERIPGGGMGAVYRAQDTRIPRWVALKFPSPELATDRKALLRFEREARTASTLNHPNICTIYEVDHHEGVPFIVMELLEGETLESHLSGRPLPFSETVKISTQVSCALQSAHDKGIIHRDIKPGNIFITREGLTKIFDFGLAKSFLAQDHPRSTATPDAETGPFIADLRSDSGELVGTTGYMSPEQLEGKPLDPRTDLFSFGSVLYEMGTGKPAFTGGSIFEVCTAILKNDPEPISRVNPDIPEEFEAIVKKALQKDRTKRHATAGILRRELEALAERDAFAAFFEKLKFRARLGWALVPLALIFAASVLALIPSVRQRVLLKLRPPSLPAKRSVVVLPFKATSGGAENQAYCQGLSEAATDKLTLLTTGRNLQVTQAKEVIARSVDTPAKARTQFGASLAFQGSCTITGDRIRVEFALMDTAAPRPLRTETIRGASSQPFALHNDVVQDMARALELELTTAEHQAISTRGTQVPGAYTFYILGTGYLVESHRADELDKAIGMFERALELDRNYALAFTGLGTSYWYKYELTSEASWLETARLSCERSAMLDPQLASAYVCTGNILNATGKYTEAQAAFQRALELEPTNDGGYRGLAYAYDHLGRDDAAEHTYLQAIKLRPEYWPSYNWLGEYYYRKTRYEDAANMFKKIVGLAPESFVGFSNVGAIYLAMGRYAEAIPLLNRSAAIRPSAAGLSNLATAYFYQRRFTESARTFERTLKLEEKTYKYWGYLGAAYYWAPGERPKANAAFRNALELGREKLKVNERDTYVLSQMALNSAMIDERQDALAYLARARLLSPHDANLEFQAAAIHAHFGETHKVLDCLTKSIAWGFSRTTVRSTPDFDYLHEDLRFQNLTQQQ